VPQLNVGTRALQPRDREVGARLHSRRARRCREPVAGAPTASLLSAALLEQQHSGPPLALRSTTRAGDGMDGWVFFVKQDDHDGCHRSLCGVAIGTGAQRQLLRERRMNVGRHAGLRSTHKADDQDNQQNDHQKPNESVARPSNSKRQHVCVLSEKCRSSPQDAGILGISGAKAFAGANGRGTRIAQNADSAGRPRTYMAAGGSWPPAPSSAYQCRGTAPTLRPGASRHARADENQAPSRPGRMSAGLRESEHREPPRTGAPFTVVCSTGGRADASPAIEPRRRSPWLAGQARSLPASRARATRVPVAWLR
jgi:hypothetical protein